MNRKALDLATVGLQAALTVGMVVAWYVLIAYLLPPFQSAAAEQGTTMPGIVALGIGAARFRWLIVVVLVAVGAGLLRAAGADERAPRIALLAAVLNALLAGSFVLVTGAMLAHTFTHLR